MTYDYIRAANTIKNDLLKIYSKDIRGKTLCVNNVIPIECTAVVIDNHPYTDSENYNLKFVFMQVFKNTDIKIKINTVTQKTRLIAWFIRLIVIGLTTRGDII